MSFSDKVEKEDPLLFHLHLLGLEDWVTRADPWGDAPCLVLAFCLYSSPDGLTSALHILHKDSGWKKMSADTCGFHGE